MNGGASKTKAARHSGVAVIGALVVVLTVASCGSGAAPRRASGYGSTGAGASRAVGGPVAAGKSAAASTTSSTGQTSGAGTGGGPGNPSQTTTVRSTDAPSTTVAASHQPKVDSSALSGTTLAFVSGDALWEVNAGALNEVASPAGFVASHPTFSADGRWLAFLETPSGSSTAMPELWLATSAGRSAHVVSSAPDPEALEWSPSGEKLLVTTAGATGPAEVLVVDPSGSTTQLGSGLVASAAWSPDGTEAGISLTNHGATGFTSVIESVSATGGLPTVWLTNTQDVLEVAGWWSGWGIIYWNDPDGSASIAADGLELDALSAPAQTSHALADTLVRSDWLTAGPNDGAALVQGGNRLEWDGKSVSLCKPYRCQSVPTPSGAVTVDPTLSAQGQLAYVQGSSSQSFDSSPAQVSSWEAGHSLWVEPAGSNSPTQLAGGSGANAPVWSSDGRQLMFVKASGLWVLPAAGGTPVQVVSVLSVPPSYYGQVQWLYQFAWASS
ncbi:MAG: TolB family protein [Acidimicrobiales bacterium]